MIKISKNIMLSIISLVLTIIALGTTTFAWFTLSQTATVSNISADVQAGEGLEVALGINGSIVTPYKTNLTSDDWQLVVDEIPNFLFTTVSTNDPAISSFNKLEFRNTGTYAPGLYKIAAIQNVDYLDFTIHFKSGTTGNVYLKDYEFIDNGLLFNPSTSYLKDNIGTINDSSFTAYASNAARLAVGNQVFQNDNNNGSNTHTGNSGVIYGQFSYLTEMGNDIYWADDITVLDNTTITNINILTANQNVPANTLTTNLVEDLNDGQFKGSTNIKIWIEGFDADAYDAIFGTALQLAISFEKQA